MSSIRNLAALLFLFVIVSIVTPVALSTTTTAPTRAPSRAPTRAPTREPSCVPTVKPSMQPSFVPSVSPSVSPSLSPSYSFVPSFPPSVKPTFCPTMQPSFVPSVSPSRQPTRPPTESPSRSPSISPSIKPSAEPTISPSLQPSHSFKPSFVPTYAPSFVPTFVPSPQPTRFPTSQPSRQPSSQPSMQPSRLPTSQPSKQPTSQPSSNPSNPSTSPSMQPSTKPTNRPSGQPSRIPSTQPSKEPSAKPFTQPSTKPSTQPSMQPSVRPSILPSSRPSNQPSMQPSSRPTTQPSMQPSAQPSFEPTSPTSVPTTMPSCGAGTGGQGENCYKCEAGKYNNYNVNPTDDDAKEFQDKHGMNENQKDICLPCPADYFSNEIGASTCMKCEFPHTTYKEGETECSAFSFNTGNTGTYSIVGSLAGVFFICIAFAGVYRRLAFILMLLPMLDYVSDILYVFQSLFVNEYLFWAGFIFIFLSDIIFVQELYEMGAVPKVLLLHSIEEISPRTVDKDNNTIDEPTYKKTWAENYLICLSYDGYYPTLYGNPVWIFTEESSSSLKYLLLPFAWLFLVVVQIILEAVYITIGVVNISFLIVWLSLGLVFYPTKVFAIGPVFGFWLVPWAGTDKFGPKMVTKDGHYTGKRAKLPLLNTGVLNKSLMAEFIMETLPQLIIQIYNNQVQATWTSIGVFSAGLSVVIAFNGVYRYLYWTLFQGIPFKDIPVDVKISVGGVTIMEHEVENFEDEVIVDDNGKSQKVPKKEGTNKEDEEIKKKKEKVRRGSVGTKNYDLNELKSVLFDICRSSISKSDDGKFIKTLNELKERKIVDEASIKEYEKIRNSILDEFDIATNTTASTTTDHEMIIGVSGEDITTAVTNSPSSGDKRRSSITRDYDKLAYAFKDKYSTKTTTDSTTDDAQLYLDAEKPSNLNAEELKKLAKVNDDESKKKLDKLKEIEDKIARARDPQPGFENFLKLEFEDLDKFMVSVNEVGPGFDVRLWGALGYTTEALDLLQKIKAREADKAKKALKEAKKSEKANKGNAYDRVPGDEDANLTSKSGGGGGGGENGDKYNATDEETGTGIAVSNIELVNRKASNESGQQTGTASNSSNLDDPQLAIV